MKTTTVDTRHHVQGKCAGCKIVFHWNRRLGGPLGSAVCPRCYKPLERTSALLKGYTHRDNILPIQRLP